MKSTTADLDPSLFASKKYEWDELIEIVANKKFYMLRRSLEQEQVYRAYTQKLKLEWKTLLDFILCDKFGFMKVSASCNERKLIEPLLSSTLSTPLSDSHRWEAHRPTNEDKLLRMVLVKNDFPYFFEDDIEHWILWKLDEDLTKSDIDLTLEDMRREGVKTLFWINPENLKSLPEIDHAHILCKRD